MNPVNKLLSAMLVDQFKVPMKWRGNIIVLSVKKGKTCNFTGTAEEMKRVKDAVTRFAAHLYIPMPFGSSFPGMFRHLWVNGMQEFIVTFANMEKSVYSQRSKEDNDRRMLLQFIQNTAECYFVCPDIWKGLMPIRTGK